MEHLILRRPRFLGTSILLGAVVWLFFGPVIVTQAATYNPSIDPDDFTTRITNDDSSLPIGSKFSYEGETDEGTETNEVTITAPLKR